MTHHNPLGIPGTTGLWTTSMKQTYCYNYRTMGTTFWSKRQIFWPWLGFCSSSSNSSNRTETLYSSRTQSHIIMPPAEPTTWASQKWWSVAGFSWDSCSPLDKAEERCHLHASYHTKQTLTKTSTHHYHNSKASGYEAFRNPFFWSQMLDIYRPCNNT